MKKLFLGLLLALGCTFASASPEQQERHQFCYATASVAADVVAAKAAGMPKEMFLTALAELEAQIKETLTKEQVAEVVYFLKEAYAQGNGDNYGPVAQRIYDACMNKKHV